MNGPLCRPSGAYLSARRVPTAARWATICRPCRDCQRVICHVLSAQYGMLNLLGPTLGRDSARSFPPGSGLSCHSCHSACSIHPSVCYSLPFASPQLQSTEELNDEELI